MARPISALAAPLALTLGLAGSAASQGAPREPRDDATLVMEVRGGMDVPVGQFLAVWARHFEAVRTLDEAVRGVDVRFAAPVSGEISWGTITGLLREHGVDVRWRREPEGQPWIITARPVDAEGEPRRLRARIRALEARVAELEEELAAARAAGVARVIRPGASGGPGPPRAGGGPGRCTRLPRRRPADPSTGRSSPCAGRGGPRAG